MKRKAYPLISTAQLATICGVSQGTVDRALHGRPGIREETRLAVLSAAKKFGYLPDLHQSVAPDGRSMLFGIIVFDLWNEYFSQLVMQLEKIFRAEGYSSIVMFSGKSREEETDCIRQLLHTGVDGIVLCPVGDGVEYTRFLCALQIPVVTVGNRLPGLPYIGVDNNAAMYAVAQHIAARGYDRLLYFAPVLQKEGTENIDAQKCRRDGFLRAATDCRFEAQIVTGENALTALLHENGSKKTAVLCPTDLYALQVRRMLSVCVPGKPGLCGFDDTAALRQCGVALDSVRYDAEQTAHAVFALLRGQSAAVQPISWQYVERGSCPDVH